MTQDLLTERDESAAAIDRLIEALARVMAARWESEEANRVLREDQQILLNIVDVQEVQIVDLRAKVAAAPPAGTGEGMLTQNY